MLTLSMYIFKVIDKMKYFQEYFTAIRLMNRFHRLDSIQIFAVSTKMAHLTFLPMTDASILSYVKMLSYAKDLIPEICGQYLNNSELHKY